MKHPNHELYLKWINDTSLTVWIWNDTNQSWVEIDPQYFITCPLFDPDWTWAVGTQPL